jgi:hypothetical protein
MKSDGTVRKWAAFTAMWGGWLTAIGMGIYSVAEFDPHMGNFAPQWVSFTFIGSIGVAIAGGSAVSRIKLAETIVAAFKAGFASAADHYNSKVKR